MVKFRLKLAAVMVLWRTNTARFSEVITVEDSIDEDSSHCLTTVGGKEDFPECPPDQGDSSTMIMSSIREKRVRHGLDAELSPSHPDW